MWRRWNERGSPGRFEFRTRAGVYVLLAAVPVLAVILADGQPRVRGPGLAVFLLLSVAQAGVCIALLHAGLGRYLARGPQPKRWLLRRRPVEPVVLGDQRAVGGPYVADDQQRLRPPSKVAVDVANLAPSE